MSGGTLVRSFLLASAVLLVAACGIGSHSPTEPGCVLLAGSWTGSFTNSCGNSGTGPVVVAQTGCSFEALIPGFGGGTVAGRIEGRTASFTLYFATPCSGTATGSAAVAATRVDGTFSGTASGFGCCGPVTGSFSLVR